MRDEKRKAPEIGKAKADPVSIEGAGDGAIPPSCAETVAAAEKKVNMQTSTAAIKVLD